MEHPGYLVCGDWSVRFNQIEVGILLGLRGDGFGAGSSVKRNRLAQASVRCIIVLLGDLVENRWPSVQGLFEFFNVSKPEVEMDCSIADFADFVGVCAPATDGVFLRNTTRTAQFP